jgi:3-oxoacyl-[acyl-carrier-protein] synthase-3
LPSEKAHSERINVMFRGIGTSVPDAVRTNADLSETCDTTDEWIRSRTGISERRIVGPGENTLTMAVKSARAALDDAKLEPNDIDLIIVATCTPAVQLPATSCFVQHELGCRQIPAFDLAAACSGFVYGVVTASHLMQSKQYRNVLVIGADAMSTVTDLTDRGVCILLGDGAGAVVMSASDNDDSGVYNHNIGSDGSGAEMIWVPGGGSMTPASHDTVEGRLHYMKMRGREVFKFAVIKMREVIESSVEQAGLSMDDIALIVPHQSNQRIIEAVGSRLKVSADKFAVNIDRFGNTSGASIPIALEEAWRDGRVKRGDWVILAAVGAGLTWGSLLMRL